MFTASSPLAMIHFVIVCIWLGLVLAETVIEFHDWKRGDSLVTAQLHFWIDTCFEIPIVITVLVTGIFLSIRTWPLSHLMMFKIFLGLSTIAINFYCWAMVVARYRNPQGPQSDKLTKGIRWTWLGLPIGLGALLIGLDHMFH